jgi:hypothetical protein
MKSEPVIATNGKWTTINDIIRPVWFQYVSPESLKSEKLKIWKFSEPKSSKQVVKFKYKPARPAKSSGKKFKRKVIKSR